MHSKSSLLIAGVASMALVAPVPAQRVTPVQKQPAELQKQDETHCSTWATQQSGFDPAKPGLAAQAPAPASAAGSTARVRSSSNGVGAMTRHDAGDAAVAGAIIAATSQPATGGSTTDDTRSRALAARTDGESAVKPAASTAPAVARRDAGTLSATTTPPAASAAAAAIIGHDAANITAGGAVAGATVRRDAGEKLSMQDLQSAPAPAAGEATFQKARIACLEARGYAVQ
jgi:hypothetical protein